jgi:uncharacterized protein YceH (UPF0502 family)
MPQLLSEIEARVIGCLIEKQIATPDQYPLTLNAVVAACNQKSNRHPVLSLTEHDVQAALAALTRRNLVLERFGLGDRVPKYQQLFCNTEFGSLQLSPQQTAIVCELLVRGAQTPGELRSRAARLADFSAAGEIEAALEGLMTRPDGPYVARLAREPGRRESRYMQLFAGEAAVAEAAESTATHAEPARATRVSLDERVGALEQAVSELRRELAELCALPRRDQ